MTAEQRAMADWQKIRYGDTDAARAALAYYRERGWRVDDPDFTRDTELIEDRIYSFTTGYEAAQRALLARLERVEGALQNIHMAAARGRSFGHQATPQTAERMVERKDEALALVLRLCADAGISSSPLRDAALAPARQEEA